MAAYSLAWRRPVGRPRYCHAAPAAAFRLLPKLSPSASRSHVIPRLILLRRLTHPAPQASSSSRTCTSTTPPPWPGRTSPPQRPAHPRLRETVTGSRRRGASSTCTGALVMTTVSAWAEVHCLAARQHAVRRSGWVCTGDGMSAVSTQAEASARAEVQCLGCTARQQSPHCSLTTFRVKMTGTVLTTSFNDFEERHVFCLGDSVGHLPQFSVFRTDLYATRHAYTQRERYTRTYS